MAEAITLTKTVDLSEVQSSLSEILSLVAAGTEIILTEGDKPVARLVPLNAPSTPRVAGLHSGVISTSDDFDQPLPDEFWVGSE